MNEKLSWCYYNNPFKFISFVTEESMKRIFGELRRRFWVASVFKWKILWCFYISGSLITKIENLAETDSGLMKTVEAVVCNVPKDWKCNMWYNSIFSVLFYLLSLSYMWVLDIENFGASFNSFLRILNFLYYLKNWIYLQNLVKPLTLFQQQK